MESEPKYVPNIEKPPVLYHASANRNIDAFEPRTGKVRDQKEGAQVFAVSDKRLATIFLVSADDSWANSGMHNGVPYIVISDEARFKSLDAGGAIYSLPSTSFVTDPNKGLRELEWTSATTVTPLGKQEYDSALEAMIANGVQVFFVDPEIYQTYRNAPDHGLSLLRSLTSENHRRNSNVAEM